jgi:hypothetical protein
MTSGNPKKIIVLAEAQNWRCAYCPTVLRYPTGYTQFPDSPTIDHVIAKAAGGHAVWDNEIAACAACNVAKSHHSAMLFWLMMQQHQCNRRHVSRIMARMTKKQRAHHKTRLMKLFVQYGDIVTQQSDTASSVSEQQSCVAVQEGAGRMVTMPTPPPWGPTGPS